MPYDYEGNPYAIESPSPAPGPGVLPITSPPADGDARNADSVRQMAKVAADFVAHQQSAARVEIPQSPSTVAGVGFMFTDPVHTGPGTGTVKPTAGAAYFGWRYRVLITGTGGLGVGIFRISTDGGKTYGAPTGIPGGGTIVVGGAGVTLVFAGTFTAADTYDFRGVDTALHRWITAGQRVRELVDHNGYMLGPVSSHREDWTLDATAAFAPAAANAYYPGNSRWQYTLGTAADDPAIDLVAPSTDQLGNFNSLKMSGSTTAAALVTRLRTARILYGARPTSTVQGTFYAWVRIPVDSVNISSLFFGCDENMTFPAGVGGHWARFSYSGSGNWFAQVKAGPTTELNVDTGIAPTTGAGADWQRLQIEYYGGATPIGVAFGGSVWRFLIDGQQVGIMPASATAGGMRLGFVLLDGGATPVDEFEIGPVGWGINWFDDPVQV